MAQKEPVKWITVNGKHIPIFEDDGEERTSETSNIRDSIEEKVRKHYQATFKRAGDDMDWIIDSSTESTMADVDKCLEYFEDKGTDMIQPSDSEEDWITWRFSGKDKVSGEMAGFDFDAYPKESSALDTLKGNGYSVSRGLCFPKPLFDYVMDRTNLEKEDIEAVTFVMKQALEDYKKGKK